MPVKTTTSGILGRLGKVHSQHKDDPFEAGGGGDLPAGIEGGVAELSDIHVGTYGQDIQSVGLRGKPFFYAAGVVLSPEVVTVSEKGADGKVRSRDVRVKGQQTRLRAEPICDTPDAQGKAKTLEDHWLVIQNIVKGLKGDGDFDVTDVLTETKPGVFEAGPLCQQLVEAGVKFRFRTWQGTATPQFPNPRVQHTWQGAVDFEEEPAGGGTVDETAEDDKPADDEAPWDKDEAADEAAAETEETEAAEGEDDLDQLLADANGDDEDAAATAQETLKERATAVGIDSDSLDSWDEVVAVIQEAGAGEGGDDGEAETAEEAEWQPKEKEVYLYRPIDPKTKKPAVKMDPKTKKPVLDKKTKKPVPLNIECEVLFVDPKKQTVNLLNADDRKSRYLNVKWDALIRE